MRTMNRLSAEARAGQSPQTNASTQTAFNLMTYPLFFSELPGLSESWRLRDQRFLRSWRVVGCQDGAPVSDSCRKPTPTAEQNAPCLEPTH